MSRWFLASIASLALTMSGCGGGGGGGDATAPPPDLPGDPGLPPIDTPTVPIPPVTDGPLDPHTGAVILAGSKDAGAGKPSPVELTIDAKAGELALVELSASGTGGGTRESLACLRTGTNVHGMFPVTATGTAQHFMQPVWNDGPLTLEIFNKASMDSEAYSTPVTINYSWFTTPVLDATEPANNDTYTAPLAAETDLTQGSFSMPGSGSGGDTLDIYKLHLDPQRQYSLSFTNSNDRYGEWTYSVTLVNSYWEPVFTRSNITQADLTYLTFVPKPAYSYYYGNDASKNYWLKIMATPKSPSVDHLSYGRYWFKVNSTTLDAPVITGIDPAPVAGRTNEELQLNAVLATPSYDPSVTYDWRLGEGVIPKISTAQSPKVTFLAPGTYSGTVVIRNKKGTSTPHTFNYTVGRGTPRILSLSPSASVSGVGIPVQFGATALNDPTSYNWSFGENATPQTSTDATPSIAFASAGSHPVTVTGTNELGAGVEYHTLVTVIPDPLAPHISGVSVSGLYEGDPLSFTPAISDTTDISRWEWTFPGGITGQDPAVQTPQGTASTEGLYQGQVRAFNSHGYGPICTFTYAVEPVGTLRFGTRNVNSPEAIINEKQLFIRADGRPVVVYGEKTGYSAYALKIAQASTNDPVGTADWNVQILSNNVGIDGFAITELNSRLAVAFEDKTSSRMIVALAAVDTPASVSDWNLVSVSPSRKLGIQPRLHVINGRLQATTIETIASGYYSSTYGLVHLYATSDFPSASEDWKTRTIYVPGTIDEQMSSTVLAGRLAVVYTNQSKGIRLVRANVAVPDNEDGWTYSVIADSPMGAMLSDVAVVNDRLVTANIDWSRYHTSLFAAQVAEPNGPADWSRADLGATATDEGRQVIGEYDNRLVVIGPNSADQLTAHYGPTDGTAVGTWTTQIIRQQSGIGNFPALALANGNLWIAANLRSTASADRIVLLQGTATQ